MFFFFFFVKVLKFLVRFLMRCNNFLKVHKNTGENFFAKYLSAYCCFVKTTILLTVLITTILPVFYYGVCFYQAAHEAKFNLKHQSDPIASLCDLSISTKVLIWKKNKDQSAYCPDRCKLLQIIETMHKFSSPSKDGAIVKSYANHVARKTNQHVA